MLAVETLIKKLSPSRAPQFQFLIPHQFPMLIYTELLLFTMLQTDELYEGMKKTFQKDSALM